MHDSIQSAAIYLILINLKKEASMTQKEQSAFSAQF